ncbi:MAG: OmpA family protein, partial [Myxococcales bacterium]|nr:OmpA family protein [Myxococcales bacterium]
QDGQDGQDAPDDPDDPDAPSVDAPASANNGPRDDDPRDDGTRDPVPRDGAAPGSPALRDSDGDGLLDPGQPGVPDASSDRCPDEPGPPERRGCPARDRDHDGVLDEVDACPATPETVNGYRDEDGCPDALPEPLKQFTGVIRGVNFEIDRATLRPSAAAILERAAEVLATYPTLRVEISGHTDSSGSRRHNLELSRARAETVRQFLITRGIDGARLETVGFGPDRPLADNRTADGRLRNRRIEFRILGDAPAPVSARP